MKFENFRSYGLLAGLVALHVLTGFLVGHFFPPGYFVEQLIKPSFYPPALAFPVVWTLLYALMGVSVWLFLRSGKTGKGKLLTLYLVHFSVNLMFTPLMFGLRSTFWGFIDVLILLPLLAATIVNLYKFTPRGALIQIPYFLWVCFALVLSFRLWRLNL